MQIPPESPCIVQALQDLRSWQLCCEDSSLLGYDTVSLSNHLGHAMAPAVSYQSLNKETRLRSQASQCVKRGEQTVRGAGFSPKIRTAIFPSPSFHQCFIRTHSHTSSVTLSQERNNKIKKNPDKRNRRLGGDSCVHLYCSLRSMEKSTLLGLTWR